MCLPSLAPFSFDSPSTLESEYNSFYSTAAVNRCPVCGPLGTLRPHGMPHLMRQKVPTGFWDEARLPYLSEQEEGPLRPAPNTQ